jgi:hypothetical protein
MAAAVAEEEDDDDDRAQDGEGFEQVAGASLPTDVGLAGTKRVADARA